MRAKATPDDSNKKRHRTGCPPVEVWRVSFDLPDGVVSRLEESLNTEDRQRSAQFRLPEYRRKYAIARGALRSIIGFHLNIAPDAVVFGYGSHGKPFVACPLEGPGLHFNVSHTVDVAVIAVATGCRVGIDIEGRREIPEIAHILERYFSDEERAFFRSSRREEQLMCFLTLWTRKEAAAKALGLDLTAALTYLKVPLYPIGGSVTSAFAVPCTTAGRQSSTRWTISDLKLDSAHAGALCIEGGPLRVSYCDFGELSFSPRA
jgi:4'-phosphopantetheinyl transferase